MDRLSPIVASGEALPQSSGSSLLRNTAYTLLAVMLAAGGWVRFNDQIARVAPSIAAPAAGVAQTHRAAATGGVLGLIELGLLPRSDSAQAVAAMGLPSKQEGALLADIRRDRLRLVRMPLFDAGPAATDGIAGASVMVSSGGYSRMVRLGRQPTLVTLPIDRVGTVAFRVAGGDPVGIGALTISGPVSLPPLASGQELDVGVVAQ